MRCDPQNSSVNSSWHDLVGYRFVRDDLGSQPFSDAVRACQLGVAIGGRGTVVGHHQSQKFG